MGTANEPKLERNVALFNDYEDLYKNGKMTIVELMQKYNLSQARVYYLVNRTRESLQKEK